MVMLADLAPASFRGATFLVPRDHLEEGRNTIDHKYPAATFRYAEDNGGTPPEYHLTCYLNSLVPGVLPALWSRLRSALNQVGPGTLVHPWLGRHTCSVKGPYKVVRTDQDCGVIEIEVCFLETGPPAYPALVTGIAASLSFLSAQAIQGAFGAFSTSLTSSSH